MYTFQTQSKHLIAKWVPDVYADTNGIVCVDIRHPIYTRGQSEPKTTRKVYVVLDSFVLVSALMHTSWARMLTEFQRAMLEKMVGSFWKTPWEKSREKMRNWFILITLREQVHEVAMDSNERIAHKKINKLSTSRSILINKYPCFKLWLGNLTHLCIFLPKFCCDHWQW